MIEATAAQFGETPEEWNSRRLTEAVEDAGLDAERAALDALHVRLVHDRIDATDLRHERKIEFQIKKAEKRLAVLGAWVAQLVVVAIDVDGVLNPTKRDQSDPGWESRDVVIRKELVHESRCGMTIS